MIISHDASEINSFAKKLLLLLIYFPESARMMFLFLDNIRLVLYN